MTVRGSCLCGAVSYEITGSLVRSDWSLPLFNVQEVSRGSICDVGERQPGPVPVDIRPGICRGIRILAWKKEMLSQELRLPACSYRFRQDHGDRVGNSRR